MTKQERIKEYNQKYGYNITNIERMSKRQLSWYQNSHKSLYECYAKPSWAKINSYNEILKTYKPREILAVFGNSMMYSVILVARNGDILHITKGNNYLVEVTEDIND